MLKTATGCAGYLLGDAVYGNDMKNERRIFKIKGFGATFSAVIEEEVDIKQLRDYDGQVHPLLELNGKNTKFFAFPVQVSCFEAKMHADALSMGRSLAGFWGGRNIDFDRDYSNFLRAFVVYDAEGALGGRNVRMYVFKSGYQFVVFQFPYGVDKKQIAAMDKFENAMRDSFKFEGGVDNKKGFSLQSLDEKYAVLLPSDWGFRDITKKVKEDYDPNGTLTRAYYFENKERPKGGLPNIVLAHYEEKVENGRYLLELYKDRIVDYFKSSGSKVVFDHAEIVTAKTDDGKITDQTLIIKLRDASNQSLPMVVRVTLFSSLARQGSYLMYSTGATVSDGRIREYNDVGLIHAWLIIAVLGASMERLLFEVLREGKVNDPKIFGV